MLRLSMLALALVVCTQISQAQVLPPPTASIQKIEPEAATTVQTIEPEAPNNIAVEEISTDDLFAVVPASDDLFAAVPAEDAVPEAEEPDDTSSDEDAIPEAEEADDTSSDEGAVPAAGGNSGSYSYAFFLTLSGYSVTDFDFEKQQALLAGLTESTATTGTIIITVRAGESEDLNLLITVPADTEDDAERIKDAVSAKTFSKQLHQTSGIDLEQIAVDVQQGYITAPEEGAEAAAPADEPADEPTDEPTHPLTVAKPTSDPTHMPTPHPCAGGNHGCDELSTICVPSHTVVPVPVRGQSLRRLNTVTGYTVTGSGEAIDRNSVASDSITSDSVTSDSVATTSHSNHKHASAKPVKQKAEAAVAIVDLTVASVTGETAAEEPIAETDLAVGGDAADGAAADVIADDEDDAADEPAVDLLVVEDDAAAEEANLEADPQDIPHICQCREGFVFDLVSSTSCIPDSPEARQAVEAEGGELSTAELSFFSFNNINAMLIGGGLICMIITAVLCSRNCKGATQHATQHGLAGAPSPDNAESRMMVVPWAGDGGSGPLGESPSTSKWLATDGNEYAATAI